MAIYKHLQLGTPVGDPVEPVAKSVRKVKIDLADDFDGGDTAQEILGLQVENVLTSGNFFMKSMYDFDLDSEDGIVRLISFLPILDPEIIKQVLTEIWPGYPVDSLTFDNNLARAEIKGYLLDFLGGHGTEAADIDSTDEGEPDGGAETPSPEPEQGGALEA